MKKTISILLFFIALSAFSQKETSNWYFGNFATVRFSGNNISTQYISALSSEEACAAISDKFGTPLFYTNGAKVWNKNLFVTPNGNNLSGTSTTSQILIIPNPNNPKLFYIFYADGFGGPKGLRYSEFDITLDNGLGDIVSATKNTLLYTTAAEKLTAVMHCNGKSIWLLSMDYSTNKFVAHLISKTGIHAPVKTTAGAVNGWCCNTLKFSPNGKLLAYTESLTTGGSSDAMLYSFDTRYGTTNLITALPLDSLEGEFQYGVSFSPNSKKLYISTLLYRNTTGNKCEIYQYNMKSSNIVNSKQTIYSQLSNKNGGQVFFGSLQNAPNGKMYLAKMSSLGNASDTLAAINFPNLYGAACGFDYNALYLNGRSSMLGLPNFMESYFNPTNNLPDTCNYVGIDENQSLTKFKLFPNPTSGEFSIDFPTEQNWIDIKLYDISRSTIITRNFKNLKQVHLQFTELPIGLYFLEITTPHFQETVKLHIQH